MVLLEEYRWQLSNMAIKKIMTVAIGFTCRWTCKSGSWNILSYLSMSVAPLYTSILVTARLSRQQSQILLAGEAAIDHGKAWAVCFGTAFSIS
jgi:hypothetical protein